MTLFSSARISSCHVSRASFRSALFLKPLTLILVQQLVRLSQQHMVVVKDALRKGLGLPHAPEGVKLPVLGSGFSVQGLFEFFDLCFKAARDVRRAASGCMFIPSDSGF